MRYKIQLSTSTGGWSDLRASYDGENYEPCLFPTRNAALAAREEFFKDNLPTSTMVEVNHLADPGLMVEITVMAAL